MHASLQGHVPVSFSTAASATAFYSNFTKDVVVPFDPSDINDAVPFTENIRTSIRIGRGPWLLHPIIDAGTCGLIVSASSLPDWNNKNTSAYPLGWEFLSSSKRLYSGHLIPSDTYFLHAEFGVKARIPVLAVEAVTNCTNYNETTDTNFCPTPASGPPPVVTIMPSRILNMGVGFGRESDGQPQGTLDKNPFLNIQSINSTLISDDPYFRNGYVISYCGTTVGLTGSSNTANMDFSKLGQRLKATDPQGWAPVECCIDIDEANYTAGSALIDTGVSHMYMTLPLGSAVHRTVPSFLDNGSTVAVDLGANPDFVASEKFTVGDMKGMNSRVVPTSVRLTVADPLINPPHITTGRLFLRAWKVAFDAYGGYLGFEVV